MDHDDDPTPPDRQAAFDSGIRRIRTPTAPLGTPVYVVERQSRRMTAAVASTDDAAAGVGSLEAFIDRVSERTAERVIEERTKRTFRRVWAALSAAVTIALGSLGAGVKAALDAREAAGADRVRAQQLLDDVRALQRRVFPDRYWPDAPGAPYQPQFYQPAPRAPDPVQRGPLP